MGGFGDSSVRVLGFNSELWGEFLSLVDVGLWGSG